MLERSLKHIILLGLFLKSLCHIILPYVYKKYLFGNDNVNLCTKLTQEMILFYMFASPCYIN